MGNNINNEEQVSNNINKKANVKKNYFYNLLYQIFLLIVPLITTPYISRVLLAEGVGQYSFSFSLITYFTIFASLGFGYYAQREIAKHQGDINKQSHIFWEINICRLLPVIAALLVNIFLCMFNIYGEYTSLMWIFNINIVNVAFDISYFFQGNEKFKTIVLRNFIIKSIAVASIFIFVKNANHVWVYAIINSLGLILSTIIMWIPASRILTKVCIRDIKPLKHLKGSFILFLPTIAVSIYTILDKTLIGLLIKDTYTIIDENGQEVIKKYSDLENGYYEQSEKIVKIVMTVITAIGIVMIPRNSNEFALGNKDKVIENIYKTSKFIFFIGIPLTLGLIMTSGLFVPWFLGNSFDKCSNLIKILSPLVLIIGLSNAFGLQFLIPAGRDKEFTIALAIGASTNLIANIIFIPLWWSYGAALATIIAELAVTLTMSIMIRKDIKLIRILLSGWKYYIAGGTMFILLFFISKYFSPNALMTFLFVLAGASTYFLVLFILKDEILFSYFKLIFKKLIRKVNNKTKIKE